MFHKTMTGRPHAVVKEKDCNACGFVIRHNWSNFVGGWLVLCQCARSHCCYAASLQSDKQGVSDFVAQCSGIVDFQWGCKDAFAVLELIAPWCMSVLPIAYTADLLYFCKVCYQFGPFGSSRTVCTRLVTLDTVALLGFTIHPRRCIPVQ